MVYLSIAIPAYNEEKRIGKTLERVRKFLAAKNYEWEIIVVDDGSRDKTAEAAAGLNDGRISVIRNSSNRGKGYAVRRGVLDAAGEVVLFSDADLSTPIEELDRMLVWMDRGYDVVIGSRAAAGAFIELYQPWYRVALGKAFNLLVRAFLLDGFEDTQCGFKCFRREAGRAVFSRTRINGFAFDVEALLIARRLGCRIKEMPVRWRNSPESKVSVVGGSLGIFTDLVRIKLYDRDFSRYYKRPDEQNR